MFPNPLPAYIDPMSGAILLQVILGGCLGFFALCHRQVVRFFSWVLGRKPKAEATGPAEVVEVVEFPSSKDQSRAA